MVRPPPTRRIVPMSKKPEPKEAADQASAAEAASEEEIKAGAETSENPDTEAEAAEAPVEPVEPEEVLDPLAKAEAERDALSDKLLRTQAEHDNYRKRAAREKEDAVRFNSGSVLRDLLPVLDSFQMGLEAARTEDTDSMIFKGMEMVSRQFSDFFEGQGIEILDPAGEVFDPEVHEALSQEHSEDVEEGRILRVVRRGYRLRERLLRPANVVVSSGKADDSAADAETDGSETPAPTDS